MGRAAAKTDADVRIIRLFDAPRDLVFRAWSDPDALKRWYAPQGCSLPFCTVDFRVGGAFHLCIRTPDGADCWSAGVYREIVRPERIVSTMHLADEKGNFLEPSQSHLSKFPDWPREMTLTVTFEDLGATTRMTLLQTVSEALAKRTGAYPSWLSMFNRLDEVLLKAKEEPR